MYPQINEKALTNGWKSIENKPSEKFNVELKDNDPIFHRDLDVHRFFLFLKMLPCHGVKFESSVKSFMVFSQVLRIILWKFTIYFNLSHVCII